MRWRAISAPINSSTASALAPHPTAQRTRGEDPGPATRRGGDGNRDEHEEKRRAVAHGDKVYEIPRPNSLAWSRSRVESDKAGVRQPFQLLFHYRPVVFSQGELRFAASSGSYVAALVAVAAVPLRWRPIARPDVSCARATAPCSPVCASRSWPWWFLPVPSRAGRQGGGAAAEFRRRAPGRFPQHADCGSRQAAARHVRAAGIRRRRPRAAGDAARSGFSCARSASPRSRRASRPKTT